MRTDYPQTILQDPKRLQECERQQRGTALASRLRLLRLLKTGQSRSLPKTAALLGYSTVQGIDKLTPKKDQCEVESQ